MRKEANGNQRFNKMLYDNYNFYAPYYRQMIFDTYRQPDSVLQQNAAIAAQDVKDAFQYYMAHANGGRPFFLMGHSQGSQVLIELLKTGMTPEQRSLLVAAYCIGYHVTAEELAQYPEQLAPAMDSTELGKLITFNSVTDTTAIGMVFVPAYEHMFPHGNLQFPDSWLFAGNVKQNMNCRLRQFIAK